MYLHHTALLSALEEVIPLGGASWTRIHACFVEWAQANGRPERDPSSLKRKYSKLLSGPPTGHGGPSARQLRARAIETTGLFTVGGAVILDGAREGNDSASDGNDLDDQIDEADGITTNRTKFIQYKHLHSSTGTESRGKQNLARLSSSITKSDDSSDSAASYSSTPRKRSPEVVMQQVLLANHKMAQEREDSRWAKIREVELLDRRAGRERGERQSRERG